MFYLRIVTSLTKTVISAFLVVGSLIGAYGQTTFQPKPVEYNLKGVVYDFETVWEGRIHPQGFALSFRKGRLKSYYKTTYQNFELGYVKDARERRFTKNQVGRNIEGALGLPRSFTYGKAHQFFALRYSRGVKTYLSEKTRRKGVAIGWIYEGGASVGIQKPYYLRVIRTGTDVTDQFIETLQYNAENEADFLDYDRIFGGSSFWKGWNSVTPTIGLHGKIAMHWAIGAFDKKVRAAEAGLMMDIYPNKIPLLIERDDIKNSNYFIKLYFGLQFGKRKRIGE